MIIIETQGRYADSALIVTIPVHLDHEQFAMGFLYDAAQQKLEALPLIDLQPSSVTIAARYFGSPAAAGPAKSQNSGAITGVIVAAINRGALDSAGLLSTGFVPGADDWEFVNYGTYISPGGQCAGQSLAAMWYYIEQRKKGQPHLYKRFSELPEKGLDNRRGIRFSSVVQEDFNFNGWGVAMRHSDILPWLSWYSFIYAIKTTGDPQSVLILTRTGTAGHAMIVYAVNTFTKTLSIADPNFPANRQRTITWADTGFAPYFSALNAAEPGIYFEQISFAAKTAYIQWPQLEKRWKQVLDNTIGSVAPNTFPATTIRVFVDDTIPVALPDTFVTEKDTIITEVHCPACLRYLSNTDNLQIFTVIDMHGSIISDFPDVNRIPGTGRLAVPLKPGVNRLGFIQEGARSKPGTTTPTSKYIDFNWKTVVRAALGIYPADTSVMVNQEVRFIATGIPLPSNARYEWTVNGRSVRGDSSMTHRFTSAERCSVSVVVYDAANAVIARAATGIYVRSDRPQIERLIPDTLYGLDTLTVRGSGFGTVAGVATLSSDTLRDVIVWSDTLIRCIIPDTAQTGWFAVFPRNLNISSGSEMLHIRARTPVITGVSPRSVRRLDTLAVHGKYFKRKQNSSFRQLAVRISAVDAGVKGYQEFSQFSVAHYSDTLIRFVVPLNARSGTVQVLADDSAGNAVSIHIPILTTDLRAASYSLYVDGYTREYQNDPRWVANFPVISLITSGQVSASGHSATIRWDTAYTSGTGLTSLEITKQRTIEFSVDDSLSTITSISSRRLETYQRTDGTSWQLNEEAVHKGPIPLRTVALSAINPDTIVQYRFQLDSTQVCSTITKLEFVDGTNRELLEYRCGTSSRLHIYFTRMGR